MVTILSLILLAFVVARFTRVVVDDSIAFPFRRWVVGKFGPESVWTTLVHCIWCTGWWLSWLATVAVFGFLDLPWFTLPLVAIAISQVAPMIVQVSDRLAQGVE